MRLCIRKLITSPAGSPSALLRPPAFCSGQGQGHRLRVPIAGQTAKGPLQGEVVEQPAQVGPGGDGQVLLEAAPIQGRAGVQQGVVGVAPAPQQGPWRLWRQQEQGRQIGLQLPVQGQAAALTQGAPAPRLLELGLPVPQGPAALLQAPAAAQFGQGLAWQQGAQPGQGESPGGFGSVQSPLFGPIEVEFGEQGSGAGVGSPAL